MFVCLAAADVPPSSSKFKKSQPGNEVSRLHVAQRKCTQLCCTPECTIAAALRSGVRKNHAEITSLPFWKQTCGFPMARDVCKQLVQKENDSSSSSSSSSCKSSISIVVIVALVSVLSLRFSGVGGESHDTDSGLVVVVVGRGRASSRDLRLVFHS